MIIITGLLYFCLRSRLFKINFSDDMCVGKITTIRTSVLETATALFLTHAGRMLRLRHVCRKVEAKRWHGRRQHSFDEENLSQRDFFDGLRPVIIITGQKIQDHHLRSKLGASSSGFEVLSGFFGLPTT